MGMYTCVCVSVELWLKPVSEQSSQIPNNAASVRPMQPGQPGPKYASQTTAPDRPPVCSDAQEHAQPDAEKPMLAQPDAQPDAE